MPKANALHKKFDRIIGANLRQARMLRNVTQHQLADHLGITYQQIQKYESGINRISATSLYRAASFLSVPVESFFAGLPVHGHIPSQPLSPEERSFLEQFQNWRASPGYSDHRAFLSWLARALPPTIS